MLGLSLFFASIFDIEVENRTYMSRFQKEPQAVVFYYNKGGETLEQSRFKDNIRSVLSRLDFVPNDKRIVNLVYET